MTRLSAYLLATSSLFAVNSAWAQSQTDGSTVPETVIVTGSLITRPGYTSPTPVTTVSASDLNNSAPVEIADVLDELPQFGIPSSNPIGGGFGGASAGTQTINLRNLGVVRTLVLLDGERVVNYSTTNAVDLNMLPDALIKRVDVVTGGASAAYGSDAVAGVVNLILDTDYVGFKGNVQYSNTYRGDYETYKTELSAGVNFDGDKGHFITSVSWHDSPNQVLEQSRSWYTDRGGSQILLQNPAYTPGGTAPALIHESGVGLSEGTEGGLITQGPLRGTQFVGPSGTPIPFNFGTVDSIYSYGGNGETSAQDLAELAQPAYAYNVFSYASYQLPFNIKFHADLDFGGDGGLSTAFPYTRYNNITVQNTNPYIPAATLAAMSAAHITSFVMGDTAGNVGDIQRGVDAQEYTGDKILTRGSVGFDGAIGNDWSWSAYYTHGGIHDIQWWYYDPYLPNLNNAINAVLAPAGNSAGIPAGTIVCSSTLTAPSNGCVPLDIFGNHVASAAAVKYIDPPQWTRVKNTQDVAQASVQGEAFDGWAGPISIAAGADYRSESAVSTSSPLAYTHLYYAGNSSAFSGAVDVYEGFGEVAVPLAKDEWWSKQLDFNAAGRVTDYSNSGVVETWKLGLTDSVTDEYRLRGTWSYDIRAPNLAELYTTATSGSNAVFDPFTNTAPNVRTVTEGNPNLTPEISTTFSGGVVYTPEWLSGFSASVDWYSINIKNAIGSTVNPLTACFEGFAAYCPLVIRNTAGVITEIDTFPVNTAQATASGLDLELTYLTDLWGGSLSVHGVGNYADETTNTQNGIVLDNAGSVGYDTLGGGLPKVRATVSATYEFGPYSGTIQTRVFGAAVYDAAYAQGYIDNNNVPAVAYLDLRGSMYLGELRQYQAYFAVDNILNTPPPSIPQLWSGTPYTVPTRPTIYDAIGTTLRVGLRWTL